MGNILIGSTSVDSNTVGAKRLCAVVPSVRKRRSYATIEKFELFRSKAAERENEKQDVTANYGRCTWVK